MKKRISSGSPFEKTLGYSRAVAQGPFCFVSGTTGYDYEKMVMPESPADQARNALNTIDKALQEAGFTLTDVVRVTYYLSDLAWTDSVVPIFGEAFGEIRPACTLVVAQMLKPEMKVEIEVTAYKG
ncbi:MAG: RidA family protein [Burkholderiaceae bacterium]|jgi:enamine deaminase RidA (YjgF/YER057c/UK114 family)